MPSGLGGIEKRGDFSLGQEVLARSCPSVARAMRLFPSSISVGDAAAPHSSLAFMFWGEGQFVFPLILGYAVINYSVFRGNVLSDLAHY
jgi:cytochrome bd-type quinol oxidase subunit 2